MLPSISLLIKPASGACNLRCKYCFYYDVMDHREQANYGFMTDETLEVLVKRAYEYPRRSVSFMFQGGEPTLVGKIFYEKFISYVKKYNLNLVKTTYSIQTNGTLIDDEFAKFLKQHDFLVGISIDGNQTLHDSNRLDHLLRPTHHKVIQGLKMLQENQVNYNVLTVVTDKTVVDTENLYSYLKSLKTNYLQFIPCIDSFDHKAKNYTLSNENYLEFLKRLFDVWYQDVIEGIHVNIRYFDDVLKMVLGYQPASCQLLGHCPKQQVIEADGSVYPCDFYVLDQYKIGNIYVSSLDDLYNHKKANEFNQSSFGIHKDCLNCKYFQLCRGGCRRNKEPFENVETSKTKFCDAYYQFFDYSVDRFVEIANIISNK